MRWEDEGYFRSYKHTLEKVTSSGRTVVAVHREVPGSMPAVQLLPARGLTAAVALGKRQAASSARRALILVRREMAAALRGKKRRGFLTRAAGCQREQRERTSNKRKRIWAGRTKSR